MFTRLAIFLALLALMELVVWFTRRSKAEARKKRLAYKAASVIAFVNFIYAIIAGLTFDAIDSNGVIFKWAFVILGLCIFVWAFLIIDIAKRLENNVTTQGKKKVTTAKKGKRQNPKEAKKTNKQNGDGLAKTISQLQGLYLNNATPVDIPVTDLLDELKALQNEFPNSDEYSAPLQGLVNEHLPNYMTLFREFLATISSPNTSDSQIEAEKGKLKKMTSALLKYIDSARVYQRKKGNYDSLDQPTMDFESRLAAEARVIEENLQKQ